MVRVNKIRKAYLGQTSRTQIGEYKESSLRLLYFDKSAIAEYAHWWGHKIQFDKTMILARQELNYYTIFAEAIEIPRHPNTTLAEMRDLALTGFGLVSFVNKQQVFLM